MKKNLTLISQMRRCSISVCSNIAEGSSRNSNKDQAHFYTITYSSLIELLNQYIIAQELSFLETNKYLEIRAEIETISSKIRALRNSILKQHQTPKTSKP